MIFVYAAIGLATALLALYWLSILVSRVHPNGPNFVLTLAYGAMLRHGLDRDARPEDIVLSLFLVSGLLLTALCFAVESYCKSRLTEAAQ